jgi:hypothetical protein
MALFGGAALGASGAGVGGGNALVGGGALGGQGGSFLFLVVDVLAYAVADAGTCCATDKATHGPVTLIDEGTTQNAGRTADGRAFALRAPAFALLRLGTIVGN